MSERPRALGDEGGRKGNGRDRGRRGLRLVCALILGACAPLLRGPAAHAEPPVAVDRVVARFYAPEIGGATWPRFITERVLAFEARLEALAEGGPNGSDAPGAPYQERHVRAALEQHVVDELLASLPLERPPTPSEIARLYDELGAAFLQRAGGRDRVLDAAKAEGLDLVEVDALFRRKVLAAVYVDRAISPVLRASEEQLREVYRTSAHPFRNQPFEAARTSLLRWFVAERIRVAEQAYLQAARSRVKVVMVAR